MSDAYYYVYILISLSHPGKHYTGQTADLKKRFEFHNSGACTHTAKFRPWRMETAIAFSSREKAIAFERYLKSHSGRAFASKHF